MADFFGNFAGLLRRHQSLSLFLFLGITLVLALPPCLLSGITALLGFLSLTLSGYLPWRHA